MDPAPPASPAMTRHDHPASYRVRRPRVTMDGVWIAVAVVLPAVAALAGSIWMADLAYLIRAGEHALDTGAILRTDTFSFGAAGDPWLNQQWLTEVVFALIHRAAGFEGLAILRSLVTAGIGASLFLACRARGADRRTAALLTAAGMCISIAFVGVRPQLFGLLLFATSLWILTSRRAHPARPWALPFLAVVWANAHGSFLFLPVLIGIALLEDRAFGENRRRLWLVGACTLAASLFNPYGIDVWRYVGDVAANPVIRDLVTEWAPATISDPFGLVLFGSAVPVVVYLARRPVPTPWTDLLSLGVFFGAALLAVRSLPWWGFVAPVVMAGLIPARRSEPSDGSPPLNIAFLAAMALVAALIGPWRTGVRLVDAPEDLVRQVERVTSPGARMLVSQPFASWFEFRLPDRFPYVDSRIELYPESAWRIYVAIQDGRADYDSLLALLDVEVVVTEPSWQVDRFLRADDAWRLAYEDEDGSVFVRRDGR